MADFHIISVNQVFDKFNDSEEKFKVILKQFQAVGFTECLVSSIESNMVQSYSDFVSEFYLNDTNGDGIIVTNVKGISPRMGSSEINCYLGSLNQGITLVDKIIMEEEILKF